MNLRGGGRKVVEPCEFGVQSNIASGFEFFLIKAPRKDVENFLIAHACLTQTDWESTRSPNNPPFPDLNICYGRDLVHERLHSHKEKYRNFDGPKPLCVCTQMSVVRSNKDFVIIESNQACYPLFYQAMQPIVSQFLGAFVILVRSQDDTVEDQKGTLETHQHMFSVNDWSGGKPEKYDFFDTAHSRSVDVWFGDRWRFEQHGTPCSFEKKSYYKKKRIRDRLNRDILCEYLHSLGVNLDGILYGRELDDMTVITSDEIDVPIEPDTMDIARLDAFTC